LHIPNLRSGAQVSHIRPHADMLPQGASTARSHERRAGCAPTLPRHAATVTAVRTARQDDEDLGRDRGAAGAQPRIAPTAAKALRVIELLAADPLRSHSLAEVRRHLGYSHGNLHAICTTLVSMGYLRREQRAYRLGPALLSLGASARAAYPAVDSALPFLQTLAAEFDAESHAAMRSGDSIVVVARVGRQIGDYGVWVGERFPLTPPIGSTFVAWSGPGAREAYLESAAGVLDAGELERCRQALTSARRRGFSIHVDVQPRQRMSDVARRVVEDGSPVDRDAELRALVHELGHHDYLATDLAHVRPGQPVQLSAPAFDAEGAVELSVGVTVVASADGEAAVRHAGERVVATARMITRAIGGRPPTDTEP
jgi:DNA-binding IclR family transcriptional regulator